ncbi:hypothetical protein HPB50_004921 [Hyalomma asiaticum]|uniref:Uncharacterized protein n=1 Tax=Hyalomma asiaticum TaxID=266040 RepID=A0ACB7RYQ4_HYAAI|nr:hypothetical protein HPB50_004921 [Hyalomma asiaticum]
MDLSKLRKPDLVMLCEEMGIEVATLRRKPLLIQALEDSGADEEELSECWELIQERMKRESEDKERETVRRKEEAEIQIREIERLRLQLQIVEAKCANSVREEIAEIQADARLNMRDLLQPYKMSEDIALFLVNFERTCARVGFDRATWPQKLLTVLPCEAADTLARLPETDADDYNKIKAALLKKFRLSAEAFRRRFRDTQKTTSETFQEFAFNMKADLVEWLKGEGVYEDRDKVVDLICLEQFYGSIDEEMRLWIQDRPGERNIERAAELADEYTTEAAVSPNLPKQYPYLFSNKSDMLLEKRGLSFGEFVVQAITRSKARELAAERAGEGEQPRAVDPCEQASTSAGEDGSSVTPTGTHNGHFREQRHCSPYVTSSGGGRAVITGKGRTAASRSCAVGVPHGRERSPVRCLERSSRCCRTQSASSDGRGTGGAFPTSYKKEGVGSARRCWVSDFWPTGGGASGPSDVE